MSLARPASPAGHSPTWVRPHWTSSSRWNAPYAPSATALPTCSGTDLRRRAPQVQAGMESCAGKTLISGVMGFALGGMFGLFMSSVRPSSSPTASPPPSTVALPPRATVLDSSDGQERAEEISSLTICCMRR